MTRIHRRGFLAKSTAVAGTLTAASYLRAADAPSEKIRVAVMGLRSRGKSLATMFGALPEVRVATLCEVDSSLVPPVIESLAELGQPAPHVEPDIRRVLEDRTIEAVVIAAPNHWHALATVWACQAGKDVYVEKPASHNIVEGRRMIEAARRRRKNLWSGFCRAVWIATPKTATSRRQR